MKKPTKLLGIIVLAALIGFSMAACDTGMNPQGYTPGGNTPSDSGRDSRLICTGNEAWIDSYPVGNRDGFVFRADGSFQIIDDYNGPTYGVWAVYGTGSWTTTGNNTLTISGSGGSATWPYTVTGNTLRITDNNSTTTLTKTTITIGGGGGTPTPTGSAPTITTTSLPSGLVGASYSASLQASGTTPITWSLQSGSLPNGLTLSSGGTISGTPTATGTSTFTVRATNSVGNATRQLSINVTGYNTSSLDGRWLRADTGTVFTISGSSGVYTQTGTSALYQDAARKGYISVGMQAFRNITKTADMTWTGQILMVSFTSGTDNATGTRWLDFTMTINSDGRSYNCYAPGNSIPNMTFTRY